MSVVGPPKARIVPLGAARGAAASVGSMTTVVAPRSKMPYVVLAGIALAIAWGLYASGLGTEILGYRKDIVYLTKQHLMLVAISGAAAIVTGVSIGIVAVAAVDGALGRRRDSGGQHGHVDPHACASLRS